MPFFRPLVPRQSPVLRNDVSLLHDSVAAVRLVMGPARLLPAGLNRLFNGIGEVTSIVEGIRYDRVLLGQIIVHISDLVESIRAVWTLSNRGREAMVVSVRSARTTLDLLCDNLEILLEISRTRSWMQFFRAKEIHLQLKSIDRLVTRAIEKYRVDLIQEIREDAQKVSEQARYDGVPQLSQHSLDLDLEIASGNHLQPARLGGLVVSVRFYSTHQKPSMERDVLQHHILKHPNLPRLLAVSDDEASYPFIVFPAYHSSDTITWICRTLYAKGESVAFLACIVKIILQLNSAMEFLQHSGYFRTLFQFRCALKRENILVDDAGRLLFTGELGEKNLPMGWPPPANPSMSSLSVLGVPVELVPSSTPMLLDRRTDGVLSSLEKIINDHMLNPLDWANHISSLGLSPRWGISMHSVEAGSPLEKLHPYDRIGGLWGLPSCPLDRIEYVGKPGDVLRRLDTGEDGGTVWRVICSAVKHFRVASYPAEPPMIRGAFSKHIQTTVWDSGGNEYTRHSFADAESIVYSAHRGEDGRLLSPLHTNSPIDVKFRDLIPEFLAKYEVVPEEIGLVTGTWCKPLITSYEAPSPCFGDNPRLMIHLFVPENINVDPFWSYSPSLITEMPIITSGVVVKSSPGTSFVYKVNALL